MDAWLVLFHHDEAEAGTPGLQRDCFGHQMPGLLCPNGPGVQRFAQAMVDEVCGYPISAVRLESCHFHGLEHGHHHERLLEPIGELATFVLGLCFCPGCTAMAGDAGVDGERLGARARAFIGEVFAGTRRPVPLDAELLSEVLGEGTEGFLAARAAAVTGTARLLARTAAAHGVRANFIEPVIAAMAYADGVATGEASHVRWGLGTDPAALASAGVRLEATGYLRAVDDLGAQLEPYRRGAAATGAAATGAAVVLRPGPPDSASAADLAAKVALAAQLGFGEVNFYNYGLYRLAALDAVRYAIALRQG
jgi:hypothetical protein